MISQAGILGCDTCGSTTLVPIQVTQRGNMLNIALTHGLPPGWVPSKLQPGVVTCAACAAVKSAEVEKSNAGPSLIKLAEG